MSALLPLPLARIRLACALLFGVTVAAGNALAWAPTLQVGMESNNNVTKSIRQEKADTALTAAVDFTTLQILNRNWQLSYGGSLHTSIWQDYSGLNLTELGAHATLSRKFGLGPYAPRLQMRAEATHQFSKVDEWSGNWGRGSLAFIKRFTPEWQVTMSGDYARLDAQRAVYSTSDTTVTATVDFDPTEDWRLSLSMGYGEGDQLSWCRASWPPFAGTPQWLDGIFGGDWFPYQSEGHTVSGSINLSRAIGLNSTLTLGYRGSEARAVKKHVYRDHIIHLQFIHAF